MMNGKHNVWIVKLNPSGGLLTKKEYEKWRNHNDLELKTGLDEAFDKEEMNKYGGWYKDGKITEKCKEKNIIAIGWILNPEDTWLNNTDTEINKEKYKELYKNTPWPVENKKNKEKLNPSIEKFQELNVGDFVWVRDSSDIYYVCKITGNWSYDKSKEAWAMDIAQRYKCDWVKVGNATEAPAKIVKKLITRGQTVSKVDDENLLKISNYLFENGGEKAVKKAVTDFDEGGRYILDNNIKIIDNLTEYDYEDFVGFYLQSNGYFIMPSTRHQSTKDYEFVAIKQNENMVVQAKYHDTPSKKLDADEEKYKDLSKTYTVYLACNNGVENIDKIDNNRIKQVENSELEKFIRENAFLIPDRIKFLVVYKKNHPEV